MQSLDAGATVPLAPSRHPFPLSAARAFSKDPIGFVGELYHLGPLAETSIAGQRVIVVSEPELVREVLLTRAHELEKSKVLPRVELLLGRGLFNTEGEAHKAHRRLVMPAFHRNAIGHHAGVMVDRTRAARETWQDGQELVLHPALSVLSLDVAARCLYGTDLGEGLTRIQQAMAVLMKHFAISTPPFVDRILLKLPLRSTLETRQSVAVLDEVLTDVVSRRQGAPREEKDLLQMLIEAKDEGGVSLTPKELRDEAMTLLLASHDTMATALTWTLGLLVQNPEIQTRLKQELDQALGDRLPTAADYPKLGYAERVFAESLRIFTPGWILARTPRERFVLGGHTVKKGQLLVVAPYWIQRDAKHYPDPERFDPDRFLPEAKEARRAFTYLPFSAGPRSCLGEAFAWMQGTLMLATLCQRWRFEEAAGKPLVLKPQSKFLLGPDRPLHVTLKAH
jgi:cytochrome P450